MSEGLFEALFAAHAGSNGVFLDRGDDGSLTFAEFLDLVARQASVLREAGVKTGDRVAVQVEKTAEALAVYGACAQIGAVLLPLNTAYTAGEVSYFLSDAEPRLLLCDPSAEASLAPEAAKVDAKILTLDASGHGTFTDAVASAAPMTTFEPRSADDLAAILYTSGTTGRSKGAMLTNRNLISNAKALSKLWEFTSDDVLIHALPIFHTHGLFVAVNVALATSSRLLFMQKFEIDAVIDALPKATTMMGVPTFYTRLLADTRLNAELTKNMRLFISGSAPLLEDTHTAFADKTGHRILERYGMTETNMNASNPYNGARVAGTVGPAIPGVEIRITDPASGAELEQGQRGMIEVRGENVFKGYWKMPEKTREELRDNGFFITGDLGEFDEEGYLRIVGRAKDLVISGGYNIYPKEIELILDDMPGVLESAVIGVPHPDMGEAVVAVLAQGSDQSPDIDAIEKVTRETLARFKQPRHYAVVESLPRNTMGKVQKNVLRDMFFDTFTAAEKTGA